MWSKQREAFQTCKERNGWAWRNRVQGKSYLWVKNERIKFRCQHRQDTRTLRNIRIDAPSWPRLAFPSIATRVTTFNFCWWPLEIMVPGLLDKLRLWPVRAGVAIVDGGLLWRDLKLCETGISLEEGRNPLGRVVSRQKASTATPHKLPNAVIGDGNNNKVLLSTNIQVQDLWKTETTEPRGRKVNPARP